MCHVCHTTGPIRQMPVYAPCAAGSRQAANLRKIPRTLQGHDTEQCSIITNLQPYLGKTCTQHKAKSVAGTKSPIREPCH
jgi:hypothetical protein